MKEALSVVNYTILEKGLWDGQFQLQQKEQQDKWINMPPNTLFPK